MNSILAPVSPDSCGPRQRASSRILLALVACIAIGVSSSAARVQNDNTPKGVNALKEMVQYLARGTGQWRAPYPGSGGPDAVGLWFEATARGHMLELTVVFHYGEEARPYSRSYWFWNPERREIQYHEVNPDGSIRMGTTHFTDERTFITLTDAIGRDGETQPNRGENVILSEDEHLTTAYVRDTAGEWVESNQLTWARVSKPEQKGK